MKRILMLCKTASCVVLLAGVSLACVKKNSSAANKSYKDSKGGVIYDVIVPLAAPSGGEPATNLAESGGSPASSPDFFSTFGVCYYKGHVVEEYSNPGAGYIELINTAPLPLGEGLKVAQRFLKDGQGDLREKLDAVIAETTSQLTPDDLVSEAEGQTMHLALPLSTLLPGLLKSDFFKQMAASKVGVAFLGTFQTLLKTPRAMEKFRLVVTNLGEKLPGKGLPGVKLPGGKILEGVSKWNGAPGLFRDYIASTLAFKFIEKIYLHLQGKDPSETPQESVVKALELGTDPATLRALSNLSASVARNLEKVSEALKVNFELRDDVKVDEIESALKASFSSPTNASSTASCYQTTKLDEAYAQRPGQAVDTTTTAP